MLNRSMFSVQVKRVSSSSYDGEVITGSSDVDQEMASVTIPSDIFSNIGYNGTARLTVSEYISSSLFQPVNSPMNSRMSVQTPVLSCTIYNNNGDKLIVQNLLNPVTFNFTSSKNLDGSICAFWNETALEWSTNGVSTVTHNSNLAVCISQHLSSFALVSVSFLFSINNNQFFSLYLYHHQHHLQQQHHHQHHLKHRLQHHH